jgi:very-short-patch-repair endonuclease
MRELYMTLAEATFDHFINEWPCESPIERLFLAQLLNHQWEDVGRGALRSAFAELDAYGMERNTNVLAHWEFEGFLIPQAKIAIANRNYRLDFAFVAPFARIAVELDGHDFHERTRDQARRDKSRDRALTAAGWRVLRFTGSEVYESAARCCIELSGLARSLSGEVRR